MRLRPAGYMPAGRVLQFWGAGQAQARKAGGQYVYDGLGHAPGLRNMVIGPHRERTDDA